MEIKKVFSFSEFMDKKHHMCNFYNVDRPANFCLADCPMMVKGKCTCNTCNKFMLDNPEEAEEIINNWTKPSLFEKLPRGTIILVNEKDDTYVLRQFRSYDPTTKIVEYIPDGFIEYDTENKYAYAESSKCAIYKIC